MMDKAILAPGVIRLAAEECFNGKCPAVNLAAFDGQVDIRSTGIAGDDGEFGADGILQKFRKIGIGASDSSGTALWRLLGSANFFDGFVRAVGAHIHLAGAARRRADPCKLRPIELDLRAADELIEVERRYDGANDSQTVRLNHS